MLDTSANDQLSKNLFDTYTSIAASLFKAKEDEDIVALSKIYEALDELRGAWEILLSKPNQDERGSAEGLICKKLWLKGVSQNVKKLNLVARILFSSQDKPMPVLIGIGAAFYFISDQIGATGVQFYGGFDWVIFFFVFGGSLACTLMRNSIGDFFGMWLTLPKYFFYPQPKPLDLVQQIVELANVSRRDGPIAMQNVEVKNKFLKRRTS